MRLLKIISCFIMIFCILLCSAVPVFAVDLFTVPADAQQYLKTYYLIYNNSFGQQRVVTSDEPFYLVLSGGQLLFSSDKYNLVATFHNDNLSVYGGSDYNSSQFYLNDDLYLSYDFSEVNYYSNFDVVHYTSDTEYDVIFYKSEYYLNQFNLSESLGLLRNEQFNKTILLLSSVGLLILSIFICVRLIRRRWV